MTRPAHSRSEPSDVTLPPGPLDALGRPLRNLRLSVTDRCNLRCAYCMPEEDYVWLPSPDILTFEEISSLVDRFIELGVDKVRLTGGEPLLRRELHVLLRMLSAKPGLKDLALTTNGILLDEQAAALRAAGLHRVTVSLDTLRPGRFRALTRRDGLERVLAGVAAAAREGFEGLKLDTVLMRGVNDDELLELLEYARTVPAELRFIEYMDVGGATNWSMDRVVSRAEVLEALSRRYGPVEAFGSRSAAPAERFVLPDGTVFGVIASTTAPFCRSCDRSRITADGLWFRCLYASEGADLKRALRGGASAEELRGLIVRGWSERTDRGAEARLELADRRAALFRKTQLRTNPHLEMHKRGG